MKNKILNLNIIFLAIFFVGCSSTYRMSNFSSPQKFYNDFNKSIKNEKVNVTLKNDSSFYTISTFIENDTLYDFTQDAVKKYRTISVKAIQKIEYTGSDYKSANLFLRNGESIKAKNINVLHDSMNFSVTAIHKIKTKLIPVDNIKTISYKNRAVGALIGIPAGLYAGWGLGIFITSGNSIMATSITSVGPVIGAILGAFVGYTYIYQFNQ